MIFPMRRRAVIAAIPAVASTAVLASSGCTSPAGHPSGVRVLRFFTSHEAAVVEHATARIAPGPRDDPAEAGHPGARAADGTGAIDPMLGALERQTPPAMGFAGGPWRNTHPSGPD